ncbi:hypothetical protein H6P81_015125 [Aristolochia fimbriata]|uniref:Glycosyltransferase subfamily 4-like N-terminal domain-containing protein n=1 Tax=Aristolochia fimbriata TaxID=158543 RepID=A0AAV7E6N6_ARIFI|nr:hypothetical protein H6P81_015125 [Aristolochia fimbriata]
MLVCCRSRNPKAPIFASPAKREENNTEARILMVASIKSKKITDNMGKRGRAAVVVLGDIGRSPRMQYHALSLAQQASLDVDVVAYGGSNPHNALLENPSIHLHKMKPIVFRGLPKVLLMLLLPVKALMQFFMLLWFLCAKIPPPDVFLVQNPPSVPTLFAVKLASWWRNSTIIIDWHNFGYTLLALSLGRNHILVKIYYWFERHFGRKANGSFCVTKAMQHELARNWGIKATVVYDRPPEFFHCSSLQEKHELFCRLNNDLIHPHGIRDCVCYGRGISETDPHVGNTIFTTQESGEVSLKPNRPALIVSSTSWTADEDFGLLLEAAVLYDRRVSAILHEDDSVHDKLLWKEISDGKQYLYPRLLFIITGKGPDREKYEKQMKRLHLKRVAFRTMWLPAEDYPLMLGSADLGICLHASSSGLDLPMKVVDMFGCGLPVCALSFSCIEELVTVEENGLLFSSSSDLADNLLTLFKDFPDGCSTLNSLREGALAKGASTRWATEWEQQALPLIAEATSDKTE